MRRLLSVVCSDFGDPLAEDDGVIYPPLPFSGPLAEELSARLVDLGYTLAERLVDLPAAELGRRVEDFLDACGSDEVVVVHVIGHGVVHDRTAKLLVVGADGQATPRTEVERWLTTVEGRTAAPSVLFLVDLCYSGKAANLAWQSGIPDEQRRAWVIAATEERDLAYAGRFSRATAVVLARIAAGGLDIAAMYEFVPIERVAREIRREVDLLAEGGYGQRVVAIRSDPAAIPDFPFIPNPAYAAGPTVRIDETTRPFLDDVDEALDWRHFAGRASGGELEIDGEQFRPGAFRGRRRELRIIADVFDAPAPRPCLVLVTGSPGVGKSALLGITVCAAHPELSDLTEPLWRDHRDELPAVHDDLAAVHCRQRHLGEIVTALARQLGVPVTTADPTVLVTALRDAGAVPPVVLDALDESMNPAEVMTSLIVPLSAVARVVVGVRPWDQFNPLRDKANTVLDLDDVPVAELRADLAAYVDDLLRPIYRTAALRASRRAIASAVATALTDEDHGWGAFLVAGLFAHQLRDRPVITESAAAAAAGAAVPRTLPEVFELNLAAAEGQQWRPVLAVLANSAGSGIPRSLVEAAVDDIDVGAVLDAARFYLRRDVDVDGSVLYRLFHQGLADHLRAQSLGSTAALFTRLMSRLGSPPRWRDAEPYLLRHADDHAATTEQLTSLLTDPGYMVFGNPRSMAWRTSLPGAPNPIQLVTEHSYQKHVHLDPRQRRSVLAIDANRLGYRGLSGQFVRLADLSAVDWTPVWATTSLFNTRELLHALNDRQPKSVAVGGAEGAPLVAVGDWTGLSVTDIVTGAVVTSSAESLGESTWCLAVGRWGERVVACLSWRGWPPAVWDVAAQTRLFTCAARLRRVAFAEDAGVPVLVTVDFADELAAWRLPDGAPHGRRWDVGRVGALAVGSVAGRAVAVVGAGRRLTIGSLVGESQVSIDADADVVTLAVGGEGVVLCGHRDGAVDLRRADDLKRLRRLVPGEPEDVFGMDSPAGSLAIGRRDGVPVAFAANQFGFVSTIELATGTRLRSSSHIGSLDMMLASEPVLVTANQQMALVVDMATGHLRATFAPAEPPPVELGQDGPVVERSHEGAVRGVAVLDDIVASASTDRTVQLRDLDTGAVGRVLEGHRDWVHTVALGLFDGRRVALSGSTDCQARLWDVHTGDSLHVLSGHKGWIRAVAFVPGERHAVTAAHDGTVRRWDLETGECVRTYTTDTRTALTSVACGPYVVAGGTNGLVHVWHGRHLRTLAGHGGGVWAVGLSHVDGVDVVLSGGEDRVVRMWDAEQSLRTFTGFGAKVTTLSTGQWRDRPIVVAGSDDGTVLGWDLADGSMIAEATFPGTVNAVAVGLDGVVAVGFGNDVGVIRLGS